MFLLLMLLLFPLKISFIQLEDIYLKISLFFSIARLKQTKKDASSLPKDAFDTFCKVNNKFIK